MSNPYAPPEDRPREAASNGGAPGVAAPGAGPTSGDAGAPTGASGASSGTAGTPADATDGSPPATGGAYSGPARFPERSPQGVPYERPRGAARGPQRPQGPAPRPDDVRRVAVLVRATSLLVLVAVLADLLAFPWYLAAGAAALVALVVGGRAMTLAARTGQRGGPRAVVGLLLVVAMLSLARPGVALLTWEAESAYARCQAGALTVQAQNSCVSDYQKALDDRAADLTGRTP